ncbi:MAG: hypothetical protein H5T73_01940 [Actinobacteria bacterium]|nr:hypothetical protein [Actinomycetota bacterium]
MKKALLIGLVVVLTLALVAAVAGCGDKNKDTAKQYMREGDGYYEEAKVTWSDMENKQTELAGKAMQGDFSAFTGEAGAALQKEIETTLAGINDKLDEAAASYKKITGLEGVQDYKEYASVMIDAVEVRQSMVDAAKALIVEMSEAFAAVAQGKDVDLISMLMGSENMKKVDELAAELTKLEKEAEKIKKDKNLV